ncbi:MAG TPA: hypothetical protein VNW97_09220 [Candidatus Saccharimonadales bacterium]|nr:hypothetical protein [Candidatus Saccharimonadales bacterium]
MGAVLGVWLAAIILKRQDHRTFPFFFIYIVCFVLVFVLRFAVVNDYRTYFIVFWISEALYAVFALLALHEIFRRVFMAFYVELWFKLLFPIVVVLALLITGWAAYHDPPAGASRLIRLVLFFGLAVNFMQVCLVSLFIFLADTFRLRWRFAPLGISLGFAVSALGATAYYWVRSEFGTRFEALARYAGPVAYMLAIVIWLDTFLRPEPEPDWLSKVTPRELAAAIRRETELLKRFSERFK